MAIDISNPAFICFITISLRKEPYKIGTPQHNIVIQAGSKQSSYLSNFIKTKLQSKPSPPINLDCFVANTPIILTKIFIIKQNLIKNQIYLIFWLIISLVFQSLPDYYPSPQEINPVATQSFIVSHKLKRLIKTKSSSTRIHKIKKMGLHFHTNPIYQEFILNSFFCYDLRMVFQTYLDVAGALPAFLESLGKEHTIHHPNQH